MPQLIASVEGVEIKHVYLHKDWTTLGRRPHNDMVFNNLVVSGEHCVFELEGLADVYVEDLHSTNGTYINGKMIKSRQLLHHNAPPWAIGTAWVCTAHLSFSDSKSIPLLQLVTVLDAMF